MDSYNLLYMLCILTKEISKLNENIKINETLISGYISGMGSFLGGIIGATVSAFIAFKISKSQIKADRQKESYNQKVKQRNYLFSLINELKHNIKIYDLLSNQDNEELLFSLESDVWETIRFESNNLIAAEQYEMMEIVFREIKDIKNKDIKNKNIDYVARSQILKECSNVLNQKLAILDSEIKK